MNLNYGVVGNGRTAALISETGNVEWLCSIRIFRAHSPSCFCATVYNP